MDIWPRMVAYHGVLCGVDVDGGNIVDGGNNVGGVYI